MKLTVRKMAVAGVLGAVSVVLGTVPGLGFIPAPTPAGSATIMHIPAIVGGVAGGPVVGLLVGFIFGLLSWLRAGSPLFADPLVAILPRLLIGVTAAYAFRGMRRFGLPWALGVAGAVGTLTNTVLVLGMAVLRGYMAPGTALFIGASHGGPEVVVAVILVVAIGLGLARAGYLARARSTEGAVLKVVRRAS